MKTKAYGLLRAIKVALVTLAAILGLLAVGVGVLLLYVSIDKEDTFVLKHASLSDPDYLKRFAAMDAETRRRMRGEVFHAASHRLARGEGTVFAYRFYSAGELRTMDDESYRKVTLWLRDIPRAAHSIIDLGDPARAILLVSHGGSAWPEAGCSGIARSGSARILRKGARYEVTIAADVPMQNPVWSRCTTEQVHLSFPAAEIAFDDLTPWLGLKGEYPYAETYR